MLARIFLTLIFVTYFSQAGLAADKLVIESVDAKTVPSQIVVDTQEPAVNGLPDGKVATAPDTYDIVAAWYSEPTGRYQHGVLGDAIEAGALKIRTRLGRTVTLRLPVTEVFEDITPRLADLDNDGTMEVITIRSSVLQGGAVTVYGLNGNILVKKASTRFIGRPNRWLNVAAVANLVSGKNLEIAIVVKPHLSGDLLVMQYPSGKLVPNGFSQGFSNHFIGSRELRLSAVVDYDSDGLLDVALPSLDRKTLNVIGFKRGKMTILAKATLPRAIDKAIGVEGTGQTTKFTVGLTNGQVYSVHR